VVQKMNDLLMEWQALKAAIAAKKAELLPLTTREVNLRKTIQELAFPSQAEGTKYYELGEKWRLSSAVRYERKINREQLPSVLMALSSSGVDATNLVRYTPELNVRTYRELPPEHQQLVDTCLETKPKAPELELIPPKDDK
jgi:hypothetical protein